MKITEEELREELKNNSLGAYPYNNRQEKQMKILHTSDWHFGRFMKTAGDLEADQRHFVDCICEIIEQKRVDAVLIAGDIYNRAVAAPETIRLYDEAMTRIVLHQHTPVVMIAGNHDGAARLASCSALLGECGLHICGSLTSTISKVTLGDAEIYQLPWITADKVRAVYAMDTEDIPDLTAAYQLVCDKFRADFTPGKKHILLAHAFIVNAETSTSDRSAEIGLATAVSARVFEGFDYVALGHIHKPQTVGEGIRYSGSPMPYAFGKEENQEKSVTILDTETMETEIVPLPLLHPWKTLEGTLEELLTMEPTDVLKNTYLRIRVTDAFLDMESRSRLEKKFPLLAEASGKMYESENGKISISHEELMEMENDPVEVFRHFCKDETDAEMTDHMIELFRRAMKDYEEEVQAQ